MNRTAEQQVLDGYEMTDVGIIPSDWDARCLGDLVSITSGESPSKFTFVDSGIPYFKVEQLNNHFKYAEETNYYIKTGNTVPAQSVVFPKRGASILLNKIRIFTKDSYMDTNLMSLTTSADLDSEYLYCYLSFKGLDSVADTTSIPQINNKHIVPFVIPLPGIKEQTAIANALSDVDALITSLEKLIAKKRAIKTAAMQQLLTGKKRLPPFDQAHTGYKQTDLGEIPEDWEVNNFSDIAIPKSNRINPKVDGGGALCIELEHVDQGSGTINGSTLTSSESSLKSVFNAGDVLFGKLRSYLRKYWIADRNGVCSTEIWVLKANEHRSIPRFIFQLVQTDRFIDCTSESYGTHMPRSDWNVVKSFLVATPSIDEQSAIVDVLSGMDEEVLVLIQRLNKTQQLKQGMMQELLTGRTRLV